MLPTFLILLFGSVRSAFPLKDFATIPKINPKTFKIVTVIPTIIKAT